MLRCFDDVDVCCLSFTTGGGGVGFWVYFYLSATELGVRLGLLAFEAFVVGDCACLWFSFALTFLVSGWAGMFTCF